MYSVELYGRVRRACHVDGMSERAAGRYFGIDRKTVSKILKHSVPPGYRRVTQPNATPHGYPGYPHAAVRGWLAVSDDFGPGPARLGLKQCARLFPFGGSRLGTRHADGHDERGHKLKQTRNRLPSQHA